MKETRIEIRKKCEDATWTLVDEDGSTLDTGTIEAGGSATVEAPNADYVITDEDSNILYNGAILSGGNLAQQISNSTFETKQSDGTTIHTDSILAEGNGSRNIADSVITLEDTDNNTISTTNVKATDSATIQAPDGTVTVVDSDNNILGGVTVPSGGSDTFVVNDLPCSVDSKEWILQFIDQTDIIQVVADAGNIATFASGSGANIGVMEVSTDGVTYSTISFPFIPTAGTYYFKRGTALITATYIISE